MSDLYSIRKDRMKICGNIIEIRNVLIDSKRFYVFI